MQAEIVADLPQVLARDEKLAQTMASFFRGQRSDLTAKEYFAVSKEFFAFVSSKISSISELSRDHLIDYERALRDRGLASKTILKKLSAISSLCEHLAYEGYVKSNLTYGLKRPKSTTKKENHAFSDVEVRKILASLNPKRQSFLAHRALIAIGFYTGLRSAEIRNLKIKDVVSIQGHHVLAYVRKGSEPDEVPLKPFCYFCLTEHIANLKERGFDIQNPEQWIFPSQWSKLNKPLSRDGFYKIMRARVDDAMIEISGARRYGPHAMRTTVVTRLLEMGVPLNEVQRLLGHKSLTTTIRYNKRKLPLDKSAAYKIEYS